VRNNFNAVTNSFALASNDEIISRTFEFCARAKIGENSGRSKKPYFIGVFAIPDIDEKTFRNISACEVVARA